MAAGIHGCISDFRPYLRIGLFGPEMLFFKIGFDIRVSFKMPYYPEEVHCITGGGNLGMHKVRRNNTCVVLFKTDTLITKLQQTETVFRQEAVEINLWLSMRV